jgi:hypothetical protein
MGMHLLGPDNKIYIAKGTNYNGTNWDTYFTHHMDVILEPNQLGASCNYSPNYFDLGSGKSMVGLPTMVNYNLGPVIGSSCDSLFNTIDEAKNKIKNIIIYPNPFLDQITIRSDNYTKGKIILQDGIGKMFIEENFDGFKSLNTSKLSNGIYFIKVIMNEYTTINKVVKQ